MGDKPFEFRLGSDNPIPIRFQNNLKDMKVIVESVGVSYQQPEFWATPAPQLTPNLIIAELGSETFEQIRLRASAASAIPGAFFRHGGGADTYLNLKIRYAAQSCGRPMDLLVNVPVRFIPSLRFLALAVVGGALMGGIARLAEKKRRMSVNAWLRAFVTACLGAALLELLGIVLVELDSVFVVFGMRLDPYQFPQVLLMAALVGVLGVNISDQLRRVMGD
jgi:hypothetical protein